MRVVGQRVTGTARARVRGGVIRAGRLALDRVPALSRRLRAGLTIFTFHDVGPASAFQDEHELATPVEVFRRQVDWIASTYDVVHPDVLLEDAPDLPPTAAVLSFDDAWKGTFTRALPLLVDRGLPAIVFLNMASVLGEVDVTAALQRVGRPGLPTPAVLSAGDVATLVGDPAFVAFVGDVAGPDDVAAWDGNPLVRFGNHLFHHWHCAALDDATFAAEYERNAGELERYSSSVPLFAFPFGRPGVHFHPEQVRLARSLGARRVLSSEPVRNRLPLGDVLSRVSLSSATSSVDDMWFLVHRPR